MSRVMGTIHEDISTFMIVSQRILLRMRNVPDKSCRENQNTCYTCAQDYTPAPQNLSHNT